jgi:hypothetical protein
MMRRLKSDLIHVAESGFARLRNRAGELIAGREFGERSVVEVQGWVTIIARERGKKISRHCRDGHNIWTNTGREYLAMLMSIQTGPSTAFREDRIGHIGVGTGSQIEEAGVLSLVQPIAYSADQFLAPLDIPPTFPLTPTRTTVRFKRTFTESEITTTVGSSVNISELGLYTNGRQLDYAAGFRDTTLPNASAQSPVAYKTFEPIGKTDSLQLEISWDIRF